MKIAYINPKPDKLTEDQHRKATMYDTLIRRMATKHKKQIADLGISETEYISRLKAELTK